MTARETIIEQISHRETKPIPYTFHLEDNVAERLDAHYGGPDWRKRIVDYMADYSCIDNSKEGSVPGKPRFSRSAYGTVLRWDMPPFHIVEVPLTEPSFDNYEFPPIDIFLDPERKESQRKAAAAETERFRTAGVGFGLFERSWLIVGFENALAYMLTEQDFYEELLDKICDLYTTIVAENSELPLDALMFGDDWGDQRGVIMGPELWRKLFKPRVAKMYAAAKAQGKYVMQHTCGNVSEIIPDLIEIGLDVLESVQPEAMDPYELKRKYGDKLAFWGGLGSQSTIPFGTPAQIGAEVKKLCREMGKDGGYILSGAKGLQPETPTENAAAVLEAFTQQE